MAVRLRLNVDHLAPAQLAEFRGAISAAANLTDERGYQYYAGIHGLPLPEWCQHGTPLFLPWHRAYLYSFELAVEDQVSGATLPWWDWTAQLGVPSAYSDLRSEDGSPNPLSGQPVQAAAQDNGQPTNTWRRPKDPSLLPSGPQVEAVLALSDFADFQSQLEDIHNAVHMWCRGTMSDVRWAAYDPIFWAHHSMIDRVWRLWESRHPGGGPPPGMLGQALPPFPLTVAQTVGAGQLGYDYAVSASTFSGDG